MNNHNGQFLSPATARQVNVPRSSSIGSGRLHFDYTGKDKSRSYEQLTFQSGLPPPTRIPPPLLKRYTVNSLFPSASSTSPFASGSSLKVIYEECNPENTTASNDTIPQKAPNVNLTSSKHSELLPSTSQISHPTKDVTLTTSFSSCSPNHFPVTNVATNDNFPATYMPTNYVSSLYSFRSDRDFGRFSYTSPQMPIQIPTPPPPNTTTNVRVSETRGPLALEKVNMNLDGHHKSPSAVITSPPLRELSPTKPPNPTTALSGSLPKPLSLSLQLGLDHNHRSKTLTIGYSSQQRHQIEEAQRVLAENIRKQEMEVISKLDNQECIEEIVEEEKGKEEKEKEEEEEEEEKEGREEKDDNLKMENFSENSSAEENLVDQLTSVDDDDDVNHFINRLNVQIQDSRDSKNLKGALAGRQTYQNPAKIVESLTNAQNNEKGKFEGRVEVDSQESTQSVADNSEEYAFLERLKNMKIDRNANRRKFAEHYYDLEDDDSELHSPTNSYLSTVTEEELQDSSNLNTMPSESQPEYLSPRVMLYIHKLVDNIFSSVKKTDLLPRLLPAKEMPSVDLYVTDFVVNSTEKLSEVKAAPPKNEQN